MNDCVMTITFEEQELIRMPESTIDQVGKITADCFKRKRAVLLCERDGHLPKEDMPEPYTGLICGRCSEVLDNERWDELVLNRV